jgi:aminoglycoside phosphotransferase (APT) family kinase protein
MATLQAIVAELSERLGGACGAPEPLGGGITNRNYSIQCGGREYVLRLPGKDTALLGIDRMSERLANEAAARLGIAPAVAAADERWLVTEFVAGVPAEPGDLRTGPEPVAEALRAFHDSGVALPVRFWVPELLDAYARTVHVRGGILPNAYAPTRSIVSRIASVLPLDQPVPCHNDLLPANVLTVGERVVLVDWEYAGMGHRLFDLGNLAVNNELDEDAEERVLAAYFGEPPGPGRCAGLRLMRIMSDAREAAWGVVQGVVSELDFDFGAYAAKHFARLEQAASDSRFERWLRTAS